MYLFNHDLIGYNKGLNNIHLVFKPFASINYTRNIKDLDLLINMNLSFFIIKPLVPFNEAYYK